jgi:eukaryotic-like serine/threonine-protein kinase
LPLSPGSHLAQYEIIAPLGAGGMANVYRAKDVRLGREVALKVMADHVAADPEMRRRFEVEVRAVAGLSHPCIMAIHELAMIEGVPVAVMELLEGETLRARISKGPCAWREAARIAAAVADGLAAAHARGVIHRDLKPENIFLTSDGAVKILDFGLALQRLDGPEVSSDSPTIAHTAQGVVLGTFGYMSPEQVTGGRVDGRSDLFALGCVLYEMLAGRRLFAGRTPNEVIASLLRDSVPDLNAFDPLAPPELRSIVSRAIARDPGGRFESARDCASALHALETGAAGSSSSVVRRSRTRGKSLAILPFLNAGVDPKLEYLTDGITESIINSLSQLNGLRIVPRSLVFRYKGLQADPATVGLALNARTILTGRIVQQGDVLNIQAELVDVSTESQLWGEQFRQRVSDLVTVQEEIAWQISEALRLKLTGAQKTRLKKRHTASAEASQEYLRGRFEWNSWTADGFRRAVEHFERAIAYDPKYAPAYAGISDSYGAMAYYGFVPPDVGYPRAREAAEQALAIDPEVAEAHASLALGYLLWQFDWPAAERESLAALRLNPQLAVAHVHYALYLITVGRVQEALQHGRIAQQMDPVSLLTNMTICWALHFAERSEEAIRETRRTRELAPGFHEAGNLLITLYEHVGRFEDAAHLALEQPIYGVRADGAALLDAYHSGGADAYFRKRIGFLDASLSDAPPSIHYGHAVLYTRLGDTERAIDHLEQLVDAHSSNAVFIACDPSLQALRGEPRFQRVLTRLGAPTASTPHTAST